MKLQTTRENNNNKKTPISNFIGNNEEAFWLLENHILKLIGIVLLLSMRACKMQQNEQVQKPKNSNKGKRNRKPILET